MKKASFFPTPFIVFTVISLVLTTIWFMGGSTLGGGEIGVPFYNLNRMLEMSQMAWADRGLGTSTGFSVGGAPYYKFFSLFQNIGVPGFLLQASFFFVCVFLTLISSYALVGEVLPEVTKKGRYSSAIFYLVNPYALVNIWNRFLPNQIMFYSFLPLGVWLFIRGLKTKKYYFAILNMMLTTVFSVAFIGPSQTVMFWGLIFLISVYHFIFIKRDKYVFFYFLFNFILWFILNFFWISQQLYFRFSQSYSVVTSSFFTSAGNFETFNSLSRELGKLSNLLLLQHGPFFNEWVGFPFEWPLFYTHPLSVVLQWAFLIYVLTVAVKKMRTQWVNLFFLVFLIGIFTSKGNSPPLGEILDFLFKNISLLEFFRNPFEKAGILLSFGLMPLIGLAVYELDGLAKKFKLLLRLIILSTPWLYLCVFLGFPFWTGLVFTNRYPPSNNPKIGYQVAPPDYYSHADKYFSEQEGIFRFITFPLGGEGIFNTWPKGYVGVEQSGVLFSTPSLSYNTTVPFYNNIASDLEELFIRYTDFYRLAGILNVKYLMFRSDFDFRLSNMRDPATLEKLLEERVNMPEAKLAFIKNFNPLKIYEFSADTMLSKFFVGGQPIETNKIGNLEDIYWGEAEKNDFLVLAGTDLSKESVKIRLVHPDATFNIKGPNPLSYSSDSNIIPFVERTSTNRIYPLVLLREKLTQLSTLKLSSKTEYELTLLGKRIVEAKLAGQFGDQEAVKKSLTLYRDALEATIDKIRLLSLQEGKGIWREDFLKKTFETHLTLLEELEKSFVGSVQTAAFINETEKLIREKSSRLNIIPTYEVAMKDNFLIENRVIYHFEVDTPGEYELLFPEKSWLTYFDLPFSMPTQINQDISIKSLVFTKEGYLTLGKIYFDKGINEIGFNLTGPKNLVDFGDQIVMRETEDLAEIKFPIKNFDPRVSYNVSFDYYVRSGLSPKVSLAQNTDKIVDAKYQRIYEESSSQDNYWFDFRSFSKQITPSGYADAADLVLTIEPWNDCGQLFSYDKAKCLDISFKEKFNRQSEVVIKNLKVEKALPREPVLRSFTQSVNSALSGIEIASTKINPTRYIVSIKGAKAPFTLVFSELFNPGWKIYEGRGNLSLPWTTWGRQPLADAKHYLVNGYANAWKVEKTGDYNLIVEYWPQRVLYLGYLISGLFVLLGTIYLFLNKHKIKR